MTNKTVVSKADAAVEQVVSRFMAGKDPAIVARAPAGAGKSSLVRAAVLRAAEKKRMFVSAPTNAQIADLVEGLARANPALPLVVLHATSQDPSYRFSALKNVTCTSKADQADAEPIVLATLDKLAYSADKLGARDALIIDEAYQADSAKFFHVSNLAKRQLLVGDSGQLSPFTTVDAGLWRGLAEDPLQTAVGVLLRNHPSTPVVPLPITRRLPPSAASLARHFYPGLDFDAATSVGDRAWVLDAGKGKATAALDAALNEASKSGWAHLVLPDEPVLVSDPAAVEAIVGLIARLFERQPRVRCEKVKTLHALQPKQVAVAVSHTLQRDMLRTTLDEAGLTDVHVDTANRLQGLEFEVVVAWHPLAGLPDVDAFHLDPGRLCVMLTRHRHACIVVGRASDADLLDGVAPPAPAFLGYEEEPLLDGWEAHRAVLDHLEKHRLFL